MNRESEDAAMNIPFPLPLDVLLSRQFVNERVLKVSVVNDKHSPPSMNNPPPYPLAVQESNVRVDNGSRESDVRRECTAPPCPLDVVHEENVRLDNVGVMVSELSSKTEPFPVLRLIFEKLEFCKVRVCGDDKRNNERSESVVSIKTELVQIIDEEVTEINAYFKDMLEEVKVRLSK